MRYTVGDKYFFIHVDFTSVNRLFGHLYHSWEDTLNKITIEQLVCTEHHKVPNYHDESNKLECNGFIFKKEENGAIYYNQYPRASYSQTSDSCDRMVMAVEEKHDIGTMTDLSSYMRDLVKGIISLLHVNEKLAAESLQKHFDKLEMIIKEKFQVKAVVTDPDTWRCKVTFLPI